MLTKAITYTDLNGNSVTETYMFHLNEAEVAEMEVSINGGLHGSLEKALTDNDYSFVFSFLKDLILRSYGEKSSDGKRFVKDKKKTEEFADSEAYSSLFMELVGEGNAMDTFVRGVFPSSMVRQIDSNMNVPASSSRRKSSEK